MLMASASTESYRWLFSSIPRKKLLHIRHICKVSSIKRNPTSEASSIYLRSSKSTFENKNNGSSSSSSSSSSKNESHFLKLLNRSCKVGNYDEGLYFLECMISKGYKPGVIHCTKLIQGFSLDIAGITKAKRVMEILEKHGTPDIIAYNAFISSFSKATNQIDNSVSILDRMRRHSCPPDVVTYNILIGALCGRGKLDLARKLLDRLLKENDCQPTVITYTILIEASITVGGMAEAIKLLEEMSFRELKPDNYTYNAILRGICREGLVDEAWELAKSLPSNTGWKPDVISCNILLRGLLNLRRWEDAERLVAEMVSGGDRIRPNVVTYSILISSLCQEGMVDKAVQVLKDMMNAGLKPDTYSYDPLISAYCKQGRMDLAIKFMEYMITNGCVPDIVNYNTILSCLCKSGNIRQAIQVFSSLEEMGCSPNTSSYNAVVGGLWNSGDKRKALEMVSVMMNKGIEPDEVTYNVLISCLCRDGMVDEATLLIKDMKMGGFRPTMITYNTLILGLCKVGRVVQAIDMLAEMVERRCKPNESTYIILVEGIAYAGHQEEAAELGNALLSWNAISKNSIRRLKKTFPVAVSC